MAFKMRGFNPGKGTGMGSAFTKKNENKLAAKIDMTYVAAQYNKFLGANNEND